MKKIILMGVPHHGNIGDNAIAIAEEKILNENFNDYTIKYMQEKFLDKCAKNVEKYINSEDIIMLHGGGNIGDTYERPEKGRREVIKLFPNNKIIIFPQTVYFSDTEVGKKELDISSSIYNKHGNLIILARENRSYEFMKKYFYNAKIYLTPDIVMTLDESKNQKKREGALLLFRTDKEKIIEDNDIENIKKKMNERYGFYKISDMNLGSGIVNIQGKLREEIFNKKIDEVKSSKIVITDRLHGMIFAAITGTPCIALGNFNHKIDGCYEWIKNLEYIKFCDNINKIDEMILEIDTKKNYTYNCDFAKKIITDVLKKECLNY